MTWLKGEPNPHVPHRCDKGHETTIDMSQPYTLCCRHMVPNPLLVEGYSEFECGMVMRPIPMTEQS